MTLAVLLLLAAIVVVRGAYGLRLRLVMVFLALALVPTLLTIVLLWRELQPQRRADSSLGISQSMESALVLARQALAHRSEEAHRAAETAWQRLGDGPPPTDAALRDLLRSVVEEPATAFLCQGPPGAQSVVATTSSWGPTRDRLFVRDVLPSARRRRNPVQLLSAPDSTRVVVGLADAPQSSDTTRCLLVALPVDAQTAQAISATVENVRRSRQLGVLEQLQIRSAGRVLAGLALVFVLVSVTLGVTLSKTLTRPIRRLQHALEDVTGGQLGRQVTPIPPGELGRLTRSFNTMSADLESSNAQLVQATRLAAWQEVARRLAHEIKNPLTPITLSIHRLRKRVADEDEVVRECLDTVLEETSHLERLADEFASFARLPKPQLQPLDAVEILRQVAELYTAQPGIRIETHFQPVPPVRGDRDQVRQVFTNLVKNAIESMPDGGTLTLEAESDAEGVLFTFLDEGSGFQETVLARVFEPTFTTKPTGSGLGLAIVRRILEDHDGRIDTGNRQDRGAWVRVTLPLAAGTPSSQ